MIYLAPVVQTLDSAIHRINHYPADKCEVNHWIEIYPVDSVVHLLNNWGLVDSAIQHLNNGDLVYRAPAGSWLFVKVSKRRKDNSSLCLQVYPKTSRYKVSCHNHPVDVKQKYQIISHLFRALVFELLTLSSSVAEAWFKHGIWYVTNEILIRKTYCFLLNNVRLTQHMWPSKVLRLTCLGDPGGWTSWDLSSW